MKYVPLAAAIWFLALGCYIVYSVEPTSSERWSACDAKCVPYHCHIPPTECDMRFKQAER